MPNICNGISNKIGFAKDMSKMDLLELGVGTNPGNSGPDPIPNRPEAGRDGIENLIFTVVSRLVPSRTNGTERGS